MRSRAVSLPRERCRSSAFSPPPSRHEPQSARAARRRAPPSAAAVGRRRPSRVPRLWRARPSRTQPNALARGLRGSRRRAATSLERDTQLAPSLGIAPCVEQRQAEQVVELGVARLLLDGAAQRRDVAGGSTNVDSARSGPMDNGSRRRAHRRSSFACARVGASYACSHETRGEPRRREGEHGGQHGHDPGGNRHSSRQRRGSVLRERDAGDHECRQHRRRESSTPSRRPCAPRSMRPCRALRRRPSESRARAARARTSTARRPRRRAGSPRTPVSLSASSSSECARYGRLEAVSVDEIRVAPAVRADPDGGMPLELLPGDAPEVVAIRPERAEVARCRGAAVEVLELVPAVLCRADRVIDGREEPDDDREHRDADEAEHDPAGPGPRRVARRGRAGRRRHRRGRASAPTAARKSVTVPACRTASSNA